MNERAAPPPPPLQGIRVVELGNYIAGPGTAMTLGDLGAEVVKIESMEGDMARHTGHFGHAMLRAYNRSKKSIALDLRQPRGKEVARRLIAGADVLVQNLRPGAAEALGLGAEALRAQQPGLVHVSIAGFPAEAPSRDRPGYDIAAQAESGMMSVTGEPGGLPQKVGATIIDAATVQVAAQATLAALFRRERTGLGETIRVSLLEVALNLQLPNWSDYLVRGVEPTRSGDGQPMNAPAADIFRTRDGMVVISAYVQSHWVRLCEAIGCPALASDARFLTNELRVTHRPVALQHEGVRRPAHAQQHRGGRGAQLQRGAGGRGLPFEPHGHRGGAERRAAGLCQLRTALRAVRHAAPADPGRAGARGAYGGGAARGGLRGRGDRGAACVGGGQGSARGCSQVKAHASGPRARHTKQLFIPCTPAHPAPP
jgi:crotonobetainyl-CoA:carnitine CoA-transferase CaiB-like acyl-CoA transferase